MYIVKDIEVQVTNEEIADYLMNSTVFNFMEVLTFIVDNADEPREFAMELGILLARKSREEVIEFFDIATSHYNIQRTITEKAKG